MPEVTVMTDVLQDQEARNRIRSVFDTSLFVEAGAGTGKTTELVERVVGLIESGRAQLAEIVAITFTEAAAGELRERVRAKLESRLHDARGEAAQNLARAVDQVEDAPMQTIHGFANRLLQLNPTSVGLPPVFSVRDATEASLAFDADWRGVARSLFVTRDQGAPSPHQRLLHMAWTLGADMRKLRAMARAFTEHAYRLDVAPPADSAFVWLHLVDDLVQLAEDASGFQYHCSSESDTLAVMLRNDVAPWGERMAGALRQEDEFAVIELLRKGFNKPKGSAKNWPADVLEQVRDTCERLEAKRVEVLETPRRWVMQGLIALVADLVKRWEGRRIREGTLEFGDLLVLADRLVQQVDVRREIQARYRYLFVDEFQDTDPMQARLVQNLVTPVDGGEERLFTVGDPKQSIYRFRNADLDQYLAVRSRYRHAMAELSTNFRTLPAILSWVDAVFEPMMTRSLGSWSPLGHGRSGEHAGTVQTFGGAAAEGVLSARVRETETTELAQRLLAARDDRWLVHDRSGGLRPIRFGDMAVLLPTRRSLANLERSFRHAGIPYRIESRSLIWSTQEIRDVVSVLRVIDDVRNENAVVAALRSPAFGCADDELARWRAAGGTWNPLDVDQVAAGDFVGEGLLALRSLRERARFLDVPAVVRAVIDERHLFHSAFGHLRQREPWNRLRFVLDQAQAWFDSGNSGLHAFLQWIDENDQLQASIVESVVPEGDDDAVRVMTIHAAKGLEFPLAAIVGLGSVPSSADSVRVFWSEDTTQPEVRIGSAVEGWQTPGFESAAQRDIEAESAERLRLLYVAVTRARDHLLVGLHRTAKERRPYSLASVLAEAIGDIDVNSGAACAPCSQEVIESGIRPDASRVRGDLENATLRRQRVIRSATRNVQFSATKVAQLVSNADAILPVRTAGHANDPDDLSYRLTLGSAVHKALEIVAFDAPLEEVERVAALVAVEFALEGNERTIVEATSKALRSQPVREALLSGRYWREVTVAKEVDGVILRGSIDLLYERDDGLVVVDYKTEAVPTAEAVHEAVDRYRYQLFTYATALQQERVGNVIEVVLLFIPPGAGNATVVAIPAEDATSALRQVLANDVLR
jgi:ATP-dependent helicase/nuclease subunit A